MIKGQPTSSNDISKLRQFILDNVQRELLRLQPSPDQYDEITKSLIKQAYDSSRVQLSRPMAQDLMKQIYNAVSGLGPIQPLLDDPEITEVMVNGPKQVFVERKGKISRARVVFESEDEIRRVIDRIIEPLGRRIDENSPMVDARLMDGSRVNAIIPPCAIDGSTITIRKFAKEKYTVNDLIRFGSITPQMAEFLHACVGARLNIVISGGTGSGKTTTLNILSSYIPGDERIITIEDAAELQLQQEHVVRLETKPPDVDGKNEVTIRSLVRNALRMRPERIIVGECRGGEAIDMLQAMNTGHDGSMTTVHANSPRDSISRLETLCLMAGMDLPVEVIRRQIASAVDLVVQQSRLRDGSRKITNISEIVGMEGDTVVMTDLFRFNEEGMHNGKLIGDLVSTGIRPQFMPKLKLAGFRLGPEVFGVGSNPSSMGSRSRR
ncbi:MAG: CpaF family protein [Anaerolineae bacterium]|jgi:pilus assembly protein CpaF|nr:CpaF family protein [Anaerolineae bacterium]